MALPEIVYKMAFSFLKKGMDAHRVREIFARGITPEEFFTIPSKSLVNKLGVRHEHEFDKMSREKALNLANLEYKRISPHNIKPLFLMDENYPKALGEIYDPPVILYCIGELGIETNRFVSVVGTRKPSPYGIEFCNKFISDLGDYFPDVAIVSGLAYGIDSAAHRKALDKGLSTIAVVAHGLNMIYPAANRNLAKEILKSGGAIISEYPFGVKPFKPNFLARNRIVAGLSEATIVVESKIKGGAMSTANFAFLYNRDVMALPGRSSDELSSGCNLLIRKNKAHLIETAPDFIDVTGWQPLNIPVSPIQRNLFPELTGDSKRIYEILKNNSEPVQFERIVNQTGISAASLQALISDLEFDGIILRHPGNRFSIA